MESGLTTSPRRSRLRRQGVPRELRRRPPLREPRQDRPGPLAESEILHRRGTRIHPGALRELVFPATSPNSTRLVGGRFAHHKTAVFRPKRSRLITRRSRMCPEFEAWDETYVHKNHNPQGRTVLQVREVAKDDNITEPEPWTWIRTRGRAAFSTPRRVTTSASGACRNSTSSSRRASSGPSATDAAPPTSPS
jgi:hypothetical protein